MLKLFHKHKWIKYTILGVKVLYCNKCNKFKKDEIIDNHSRGN